MAQHHGWTDSRYSAGEGSLGLAAYQSCAEYGSDGLEQCRVASVHNYRLNVNGRQQTVDVPADMPLLWVLRDTLNLKGTKFGCGIGACGACTVHINGEARRSCSTQVSTVNQAITTIEGLSAGRIPSVTEGLDGNRRTAVRLLSGWTADVCSGAVEKYPTAHRCTQINTAMTGNVCRCGTYQQREAIHLAANGGRRA